MCANQGFNQDGFFPGRSNDHAAKGLFREGNLNRDGLIGNQVWEGRNHFLSLCFRLLDWNPPSQDWRIHRAIRACPDPVPGFLAQAKNSSLVLGEVDTHCSSRSSYDDVETEFRSFHSGGPSGQIERIPVLGLPGEIDLPVGASSPDGGKVDWSWFHEVKEENGHPEPLL